MAAINLEMRHTIQGSLVFDNGLPAAEITVRLYNVGFAGKDTQLGEVKADGQGKYSITYSLSPESLLNIQVRVLDASNNEVTISTTKFNAQPSETLNLVVPAIVQPLVPEFQRLSTDVQKIIGGSGIQNLASAQETGNQQDLTLLNQSTGWDARLLALAATAAQQTAATGLSSDVLYALYRMGLPSDPSLLAMIPSSAIQIALTKANQAGLVSLNDQQISSVTTTFQNFANKTLLSITSPGAVSSYGELLNKVLPDTTQQAAFANLYFSNPTAKDFWSQAANLKIPAETLDTLKLQGKFLQLTFNNAALTQKLQQDIGSLGNIAQMADKDYHLSGTWQTVLNMLAGNNADQALQNQALQKLIPAAYAGTTTQVRLAAYTEDMARKVRISFPTEVVARMIESKDISLNEATAPNVTAFLRAAATQGYSLGRTPLNAFLKNSAKNLPAMDASSTESLKTLHRLYQITPSSESLQAAVKVGFTSARDIASYSKDEFLNRFASTFPPGEALLVYGQAQTVSAVTFNFFSMAKQLDNSPPIYGLSASDADRQNAKNAIIQQFPSMASLFGNMDFCECEDCRSVLSPAAYFVDVLEFLNSSANKSKGYTPLDVLIGSQDGKLLGRRPDLGALPLTCENTNTAMPYIDLVNEILEYYVAYTHLDANYAYDTGTATTADLTAEPQHILPKVYNISLKQAVYPLNLPFDLWIETVRGFLNYFQMPLTQVLNALRPADNLELFTDTSHHPYYRAQILAESLGLSPSEYQVLTATNSTVSPLATNWFNLYGYLDEATALNGKPDPTDLSQYQIPPLKNAKNLSQLLGLSYQELTDLVTTGFLNPYLYALIFQLNRFGIDMSEAFSYTNQPGYPALTAQQNTDFETLLQGITNRYKSQNSTSNFEAKAWINNILPANYSNKVLVLADPDSGCNFGSTALQYADNGIAATPLDFVKLNLFVRLWKKLGWSLDETDRALQLFFPSTLPAWSDPNFGTAFTEAWKTALVYLAHLDDLNTKLAPAMGRVALLPLWSNLPAQGANPLYAQLFLTPSVLNNDFAFDDPNGLFPTQKSDLQPQQIEFSAHLAAVQGVLGLTADEVTAILADINVTSPPDFTLANLSICYAYSTLAKCLQMKVKDMISLKAMSGLNPFHTLSGSPLSELSDDVLFNQTILFVQQVQVVQNSGFTVEDLQYLLRHQFDPVGKYQADPNAMVAMAQSIANGLQQIQAQNSVPPSLISMPESLIDQVFSGLMPDQTLKTLFTLLTNSQTFTKSQSGVVTAIDPKPFSQEAAIAFSYDATTQTQSVSFQGLLLDSKKTNLEQINSTAPFSSLLDSIQLLAQAALDKSIGDILGVWASLIQYEAVKSPVANAIPADPLTHKDPALAISYDGTDTLEWLGYRGVLTDTKKADLVTVNNSPDLLTLLNDVQGQALPAYNQLIGSLLAMWVNVQTFTATLTIASPSSPIDVDAFFSALMIAQQNQTIADPVPQLQFSYDPASQNQTLICAGVLADSMRIQLAALLPSSTVLANLLQAVRTDAMNLFQTLANNILTVVASDLDNYSKPFIGLDVAKQQKRVKAELVNVFMPLMAKKLSRQFILQTLSANFGADPVLIEALVTDATLLTNPSNPGISLLGAFFSLGQQGVSASYYTSVDGSGSAQESGIAGTADTSDPTNSKPGTASAHFEGYLQVPTDGPYRFIAELGNTKAAASFHMDPQDPTALLANPVISSIAEKNHDEVSQFVQLKGGILYHFTLDFSNLGANGASLLIQGETLPKGPLSQLVLFPEQTVVAFIHAKTLLAKVLQILQVTGLNVREISYIIANPPQFSNLKLSSLPTQPSDDSLKNAVALFAQFLTLADYADLRKGPAGGSDGLIDVFQSAKQTAPQAPNTPWSIFANLTRRDSQAVQNVAMALGSDPLSVNNIGIRRIWQALQLLQIVGIPVASLTASTAIASLTPPAPPTPDLIAENFKNAVKAKYTVDSWRPIAQSIFDKLRQKKRDALVAYLVKAKDFDNSNQLFEYFLVDPGMEPVVQTSRLRLAMSSLQTFVQRCLLNLENGNSNPDLNVAPSAIDADWWEWMKRYRVWQANREIFLFPENWMVPELRLDKTDLFQTLESALLQGDVTADLANDAFFDYLKGLDLRARLDVVAMYLDQNIANAGLNTLYVLGRTYGLPHKYFYRTYSSGTWSGWEEVTSNIEGNHITLVIWKGRLNIFWVTFIPQPQPPQASASTGSGTVSNLTFDQLAGAIYSAQAIPQVQVQLHWIEYVQGKWTNCISSEVNFSSVITTNVNNFNPDSKIYIHVKKEVDNAGNEGAVKIILDYDVGYAFRVTSKNCSPDFNHLYWEERQLFPYSSTFAMFNATSFAESDFLRVQISSEVGTDGTQTPDAKLILQNVNNYELLACANSVLPPFVDPNASSFYEDAGSLVAPFFFKDTSNPNIGSSDFSSDLTFFVQPSLTETTIVDNELWAIVPSLPAVNWTNPSFYNNINVIAQVPVAGLTLINKVDPVYSIFQMRNMADWATNPKIVVSYGNALIGTNGKINLGTSSVLGFKISASSAASVATTGVANSNVAKNLTVVGKQGLNLNHLQALKATQVLTPPAIAGMKQ